MPVFLTQIWFVLLNFFILFLLNFFIFMSTLGRKLNAFFEKRYFQCRAPYMVIAEKATGKSLTRYLIGFHK